VLSGIRQHLGYLDRQTKNIERLIRDLLKQNRRLREKRNLLTSIRGIGDITAARLLAEMPNMLVFKGAKRVAASPDCHHNISCRERAFAQERG